MPRSEPRPPRIAPRRRADAERNVARILDATVESLASDPDASMAEIARRAGVVRATIYVHFPTRESLIDAVTHRAVDEIAGVIEAARPEAGDPVEALRRVVAGAWRTLGRYHALVAINSRMPDEELHDRHESALAALQPLIERGQEARDFRSDVPASWHLATVLALIHGASGELRAGRIAEELVEDALIAGVIGAITAPASTAEHARTG